MCIRDSACRRLAELASDNGEQVARVRRIHLPVERPRAEGCLLYTSDAADDLLCVDLGGRRIIKKKKLSE